MAIRYDAKLNKEINRVVRNFNNKINRLKKEDSSLLLPETVSVRGLKSEMFSRKDMIRKLKDLERFSIRGMENTITTEGGVDISKYEYDLIKRESRRIKSYLTRQLKTVSNITPTVAGVPQDATYSEMGSQQVANLIARREALEKGSIAKMSNAGLKDFISLLNKNRQRMNYQTNIFRDNYMNKMLFNLGYFIGYDKDKINDIKAKMNELSDKQFMEMFNTDLLIQSIRDFYNESHNADPTENAVDLTVLYDELYKNIDSIIENFD